MPTRYKKTIAQSVDCLTHGAVVRHRLVESWIKSGVKSHQSHIDDSRHDRIIWRVSDHPDVAKFAQVRGRWHVGIAHQWRQDIRW